MPAKVVNENIHGGTLTGYVTDSYGLPVQERTAQPHMQYETSRGKSYGMRVPILSDLDGIKYYGGKHQTSCRFDIVEKVTTVIKPGTYGSVPNELNAMDLKLPGHSEDNSLNRVSINRQPTFHSTVNNTRYNEQKDVSILEKIGPYHWNSWLKSGKEGDARDVLYRNTYCQVPEQVRYRTLMLPRISTTPNTDRPWTVPRDDKHIATMLEHGEYNKVMTIIPQQPRGTVVRFREYMKPITYASDDRSLEVKKCDTRLDLNNNFTAMKSTLPLIRHDFRRSPRKSERPLKFENARYIRKSRETLFDKHLLPVSKNAFDRDYSSADTFKEYLDSLQQTTKANTPGMHSNDMIGYRHLEQHQSMDYHNRVLQSVSDVNQPEDDNIDEGTEEPLEISVEIKQTKKPEHINTEGNENDESDGQKRSPLIDNLSSVHGSNGRSSSETRSVTVPRSSSVADAKSVVRIPSVASEADHVSPTADGNTQTIRSSMSKVEGDGAYCPANTPTPEL